MGCAHHTAFQAAIHVTVENQRGVLAKVASEIAEAGSNIDSITMEEDRAVFTTMHFVLRGGKPAASCARDAGLAPPARRPEDHPDAGIGATSCGARSV